jgi:hypothetical protein
MSCSSSALYPHLVWALFFFFTVNAIYIPLCEEPGLEKRFGNDYRRYQRHVPRWLPRLRPWMPEDGSLSRQAQRVNISIPHQMADPTGAARPLPGRSHPRR